MRIDIGDVYSTIHGANADVVRIIKLKCRARPQGYQFSKKYKKKRWNGYISLMLNSTTFPTGLARDVVLSLRDAGYRVTINWNGYNAGQEYIVPPDVLNGITLRDYQITSAEALLKAGRGIAKMATNAGKTEVMAAMIAVARIKVLIIVSRKELMYQTAKRLSDRLGGVGVGLIGDGKFSTDAITVGMVQTLAKTSVERLLDVFADLDGIFIDECHHGSSAQHLRVLERIPGFMRFGFSGTPLKKEALDDLRLVAYTGNIVCEVTNDELIELGYSAQPIINMLTVVSEFEDDWELPYQKAYKELIVDNEERNVLIKSVADKHKDDTVLILVRQVAHGKTLQSMMPGSRYIHGSDTTDYRQQVLSFMKEESGVYIATTIVDEGVDIPAINVLILAGGGKSERGLLQRVGRGLRQKEENVLTVYDFIDDTNKYLLNHSEDRVDVYIKEGFEVLTADDSLH